MHQRTRALPCLRGGCCFLVVSSACAHVYSIPRTRGRYVEGADSRWFSNLCGRRGGGSGLPDFFVFVRIHGFCCAAAFARGFLQKLCMHRGPSSLGCAKPRPRTAHATHHPMKTKHGARGPPLNHRRLQSLARTTRAAQRPLATTTISAPSPAHQRCVCVPPEHPRLHHATGNPDLPRQNGREGQPSQTPREWRLKPFSA